MLKTILVLVCIMLNVITFVWIVVELLNIGGFKTIIIIGLVYGFCKTLEPLHKFTFGKK